MLPEQESLFEALYQGMFNKLLLYAQAGLSDKSKAMDVVQDTYHEAVLKIEQLMVHPNPEGWLMQTTKNKIKEYNRTQTAYINRCLSFDSELLPALGREDPEVKDLENSGGAPLLDSIRKLLTLEERFLFERLVFDKASHLEVSKELGITVWTSQKRFERIKKKLKQALSEET